VEPYDNVFVSNQYPTSRDDCCKAYQYDEDESLLEACEDPTMDALCTLEVFETTSMTCDTVTSWRQVYMTAGDEVGAITYMSSHSDSTPLRCCLKDEDFAENVNACTGVDDDEKSWTWDVTTNTCTESTCTRFNLYLPNDWAREAILIMRGDTCVPKPD
jgi:hypothetical protein